MKAQNVSKTIQEKLSRLSALDDDGVYNIPAYLIAQLGKNFQAGLNGSISGNELLSLAMEQILLMLHSVGGVKSSDKNLLQLLKTI